MKHYPQISFDYIVNNYKNFKIDLVKIRLLLLLAISFIAYYGNKRMPLIRAKKTFPINKKGCHRAFLEKTIIFVLQTIF
jgi:hypothetical protein